MKGKQDMKNMTALISLFARAYHCEKSPAPVFRDSAAGGLLSESEKAVFRIER